MYWHRRQHSEQKIDSTGTKASNEEMGLMKLRHSCKAKDTIIQTKQQPAKWGKIFNMDTSNRGLITTIYEKLKKT